MEWFKVLTIISAVFGMFLWGQRESRTEIRETRAEMRSWKTEINKSMKDFHGRLCKLEEKYYQIEKKKQ